MTTILFQGDSITDSGRDKSDPKGLGDGYGYLAASALSEGDGADYTFYNRGVNGNTVTQMHERMEEDMLELRPDVMSILIGINDIYHAVYTRGDDELCYFRSDFDKLMADIEEKLPETRLMFLEPFILPGELTEGRYDAFFSLTREVAAYEKAYADAHGIPVIPLQQLFLDNAGENPTAWLKDGIHPTPQGHELIKNEWLKAYKAL